VVISDRSDWWNCSSTPSRFKAGIIWSDRSSVSILINIQWILIFIENKYVQSWHTSRHNTRAGFDSAPLVSVEKGCSSIMRYDPPLNDVGAAHTKPPGLLLT
jgi:hypothetical protein